MFAGRQLRFLPSLVVVFAFDVPATGQEAGLPVFHVFDATEMHTDETIYAVAEGPDGILYLGGTGKVLEFDGHTSRELPLPVPTTTVSSLATANDGTLYVNYGHNVGMFPPGARAPRTFHLIEDPAAGSDGSAKQFSNVKVSTDGVYFTGRKSLNRWQEGRWQSWPTDSQRQAADTYVTGGAVYFRDGKGPLEHIDGNGRKPVLAAGAAVQADWRAIRRERDGGWRIATASGQIFAGGADGPLHEVPQVAAAFLQRNGINRAVFLDDGVLVATTRQGLLWLDPTGRPLARLDRSDGLPEAATVSLVPSRSGGLWALSDRTLLRIEAAPALTRFGRANGLGQAAVRALIRHAGVLFAATDEGVFALRAGDETTAQGAGFERVPGLDGRCDALLTATGTLLAAGPEGIHQWQDGRFQPVFTTGEPVLALAVSPHRPETVLFSTAHGLGRIHRPAGSWAAAGPVHSLNNVRFLAEAEDGLLLTGGTRGLIEIARPHTPVPSANIEVMPLSGLIAIRRGAATTDDTAYIINQRSGLSGYTGTTRWGSQLIAFAENGVFRLNQDRTDLEPLPLPEFDPARQRVRVFRPVDAQTAWLALAPSAKAADEGLGWSVIRVDAGTGRMVEQLPPAGTAAAGEILTLLPETGPGGRVLWVGGTAGLVRIEPDRLPAPPPPVAPLIRAVGPAPDPAGVFTHAPTELRIDFATPWFHSATRPAHQTRLDGLTDEWSAFTPASFREFNRLPPGHFVFRVRARTPDGRTGPETALAFTVQPPWWRTPWAYAAGLLSAAAGIAGIVRWRNRTLRRRNEELERLISVRTADLRAAKVVAESSSQAKSAFLASMSHELRTPLNAILGFAQILRRAPDLSAEHRQRLAIIGRNGDHLLQMINEILDLSMIEAGKLTLAPRATDLPRLVRGLADTFAQRAADKGLQFYHEPHPALPRSVWVDELKLRQVLINLLGNALKFTDAGRVTFAVAPAGDRVRFSVSDTGVGIPLQEHTRIFEAFHQAAPTTGGQGTGLGLAISQRIVRLMGGIIHVESRPEQGSRFWFELELPPAATAATGPADRTVTGYAGRRRRILIVDDEPTNRDVLHALLEPLGFTIETCSDGPACLGAFTRQPADAILLDLRLPGELDGYATARALRALPTGEAPAIIAVSASVFEADRQTALDAGCDAFVPKPFTEERLFGTLADCLDLEWILQEPAGEPATKTLIALPATVIEEVRALARRGDIMILRTLLKELATSHPDCAAELAQLDALAAGFQLGRLRQELRTWGPATVAPPP